MMPLSIARLVLSSPVPEKLMPYSIMETSGDEYSCSVYPYFNTVLTKACKLANHRYNILQTFGGFHHIVLLTNDGFCSGEHTRDVDFIRITCYADILLNINLTDTRLLKFLRELFDYITFGVDVSIDKSNQHAELVGIFDTKRSRFRGWTGKSYPLGWQQDSLIYCTSLESHFYVLNKIPILILGCHDLNIFNARSIASMAGGSYKYQLRKSLLSMCNQIKPEVVLHHPHTTDTPNIWRMGWAGVRSQLKSVKQYSSGIRFENIHGGKPRDKLKKVLETTKQEEIDDIVIDPKNLI